MKVEFNNVMWPTDFSATSLEAADAVRNLTRRFGAKLHIVHVAPLLVPDNPIALGTPGSLSVAPTDIRGAVRSELDRLVRERFDGDEAITRAALVGTAWYEICEYAKGASIDLIVLSTHGYTGMKHLLLGSVAERVTQHVHCPVLVLRSFDQSATLHEKTSSVVAPKRILWPTDFSDLSLSAADFAGGLHDYFEAELYVVHVRPPDFTPYPYVPSAADLGASSSSMLDPAMIRLARIVEELFESDTEVKREVLSGTPWQEVCGFAERNRIDWIIVATHGRTGLKHVLMGSVAERIVQHAPCSVLVVKSHEDQLADASQPADASRR